MISINDLKYSHLNHLLGTLSLYQDNQVNSVYSEDCISDIYDYFNNF